MQCPRCENPLIVLELNGIEIDYCTDCDGIWLDSGELELLLGDHKKADDFLHSFKRNKNINEKKMKCPVCGSKMNKVEIEGVEPIVIDECSKYCGLWFDSGELLEVVKKGSFGEDDKVIKLLEEMFENKLNK